MSDHNPNLDNYKVVAEDGNEYGPVSAELVQAWLKQGVIDRHSMVKKEGDDQWHALLNFAELQAGPPVLDAPPPAGGSEPAPSPETQAGHFGKPISPPDYFQDPALASQRKGLGKGAIVGIVVGVLILMCILTAVIGAVLDQSDDTVESDGSITIKEVEAMTMARMTLNYIANGQPDLTVKSVTLNKRNKREYYGSCVIDSPEYGNINADLEITVDGDKVTIVSIDIDD